MKQLKSTLFKDVSKACEALRLVWDQKLCKKIPFLSLIGMVVITVLSLGIVTASMQRVTVDDNGTVRTFLTLKRSTEDILASVGVSLQDKDSVQTATTGTHSLIRVDRAFPVRIVVDQSEPVVVHMTGGTVSDALSEAGITLNSGDTTQPASTSAVKDGLSISVQTLVYTDRTETEKVAFTSSTQYSDLLPEGTRQVTRLGVDGKKTLVYRDYLQNGTVVRTELISSTVTTQPVNEVVVVGTGENASLITDTQGNVLKYSSVITGTACAYTTPASNRGITSTGTVPSIGTVAVNPKIIPYGTKLYIVSTDGYVYGYGIASDTGGDVLRNKIVADLYMDTVADCYAFGRRKVNVYLLE